METTYILIYNNKSLRIRNTLWCTLFYIAYIFYSIKIFLNSHIGLIKQLNIYSVQGITVDAIQINCYIFVSRDSVQLLKINSFIKTNTNINERKVKLNNMLVFNSFNSTNLENKFFQKQYGFYLVIGVISKCSWLWNG